MSKRSKRREWPWPPEDDERPLPSPEEILAAKGPNGYWPKSKLQEWGVPTEPKVPDRWREMLNRAWWRRNVPDEVRDLLGDAYDEEGVQVAWRSEWRGLARWKMFEAWWQDPDMVRRALAPPATEITLVHIDGAGRIEIKLPMQAELAGQVLEALAPLGWAPVGDVSLLFEEDQAE